MINLQTYMGGQDLWGMSHHQRSEEKAKNLVKPIFDDGLLEVATLLSFASQMLIPDIAVVYFFLWSIVAGSSITL